VPAAALIGVLINPDSPKAELLLSNVQTAARNSGQPIHILNVRSEGDLEDAFATIVAQHVGALVVTSDAFFNSQFDRMSRSRPAITCPMLICRSGNGASGIFAQRHRRAGVRAVPHER
jgi:ABC-type uncharacterized transport system substrate-binding protein